MSVLTGLFNVLALLYVGRAVLLVVELVRNRDAWRQERRVREGGCAAEAAALRRLPRAGDEVVGQDNRQIVEGQTAEDFVDPAARLQHGMPCIAASLLRI